MIKFTLVIIMFGLKFHSSSSASLLQYMRYDTCNDTVIFTCINENSAYVNWDINSDSGILYSVTLSQRDSIGRKYSRTLGSSTIIAEAIAANSTYLTSTIAIIGIITLMGRSIACNGVELILDSTITNPNYIYFLPTSLLLIPTGQDSYEAVNFTVTWISSSNFTDTPLTFNVLPPPLYQDAVRVTNKSSIMLSLINNTAYSVEVAICQNENHTVQFNISRCPLIMNSATQSVLYYNVSITGTLTALIMCSAGHQVYFECGRNRHWNADLTTISSHPKTSLFPELTTSSTTNYCSETSQANSLNVKTVAILTGSIIGAATLCYICGVLTGILCSRITKKTKSTLPKEGVPGVVASDPPNVPVYEDIKLEVSTVEIELSPNIAYDQIHKT